jgi:hypothetical protein
MNDGKQFTIYDGNNKKDAEQSEKFAELLLDKSKEPAIVVRNDDPTDSTKAIDDADGKMMAIITKSINRMIIDRVINTLNQGDLSVTADDINEINFIKDDREINSRLIAYYSADGKNDKIMIKGRKADILISRAHSYADVVVNGHEYYMYFYNDSNKKSCAYVSSHIEKIWKKMGKLGHTNSYIAFMTYSNPYAIEDYCGLPVDKEYIDILIKVLGEDAVNKMMEGAEDEYEDDYYDDENE